MSPVDEPLPCSDSRDAAATRPAASVVPAVRSLFWVAIQRNRRSGAGCQHQAVTALVRELRQLHLHPRLFSSRTQLDSAVRGASQPPVAIVAAGGDGTVLDVLNRHPTIPVAILPLGTENLLARYCGIRPRDGAGVARMIAAGRTLRIDLGRIGDRRFSVLASCGFDADVIHRAHAVRQGHITRWHYLGPICRALRGYAFPELRVYLDADPAPLAGGLVIVANLSRYALALPLAPSARADDGLFDVRVFPQRSIAGLCRDFGRVVLRRTERSPDVLRRQARQVRVESDLPVPVQVDGDPLGATPVEFQVEPSAATLFRP